MPNSLEFEDWKKNMERICDSDEWITVYCSNRGDSEWEYIYCALVPNSKVKKSLIHNGWDLHQTGGFPGHVFSFEDGKEVSRYYRYSNSHGAEPLVILRTFFNIKPDYIELSEEFRLYFQLYEDHDNHKLVHINEDGDVIDVAIVGEKEVRIKLKYIKEFLAVKKMSLGILVDVNRFSKNTLDELGIKENVQENKGESFIYTYGIKDFGMKDKKTQAWFYGKRFVSGLRRFKPKMVQTNKVYEKFIVGVDKNGNEKCVTCDPDKLRKLGMEHFYKPIFFDKKVLSDYYAQPEKYTVKDGWIYCGSAWALKVDNSHKSRVVAYLGHLGEGLGLKEQKRWRGYNVTPQAEIISFTAWKRDIMAEFFDSQASDLFFKQRFSDFQEKWHEKFGWHLFKPLRHDDLHYLKALRIPLTNDQKEFDDQIFSLVKIIIDSLNEKELVKEFPAKDGDKGITKLERFLNNKGHTSAEVIAFLRDLQDLRSTGSAHRKSDNYDKALKRFKTDKKSLSEVCDAMLIKSIWMLNTLERMFLSE